MEQPGWKKHQVPWPEGQHGEARIEHFIVTEKDEKVGQLRAVFSFSSLGRCCPAGQYTRLFLGDRLLMSDTPDEIMDHNPLFWRARGRMLINGLGLGVVVRGALMSDQVEHVTVIEINPDVIALVGPHLSEAFGSERLEIIEADALTWKPPKGARYDAVWHDIWDNICTDNLPDMHRLHRRYGRRCDWQGSWARAECECRR